MSPRHTALVALVVMALLVIGGAAAVVVLTTDRAGVLAERGGCPALIGSGTETYCEALTLGRPSGQACSVGPTQLGVFHYVSYSFHAFVSCQGPVGFGINGTLQEDGGTALSVVLFNGAPPTVGWFNWTSPDGRVAVDSFMASENLTLAVET